MAPAVESTPGTGRRGHKKRTYSSTSVDSTSPLSPVERGGPDPSAPLSSVVIKSKNTKIIVSLLEPIPTKRSLQVQEVEPPIAYIGRSYEEALKLREIHEAVLKNVESKHSPVRELLRQADEGTQRNYLETTSHEELAALSSTWDDLKMLLHKRKVILEKNANFQAHYVDFEHRTDELISLCRSKDKRHRKSTAKLNEVIMELASAKKAMLESCVCALQDGELVSEELLALWNKKLPPNSKPSRFKETTSYSIEQVDDWLEMLHTKRMEATKLYEERMGSLKINTDYIDLAAEISELEKTLNKRIQAVDNMEIGKNLSESRHLLEELETLKKEHDSLITDRIKNAAKQSTRYSDMEKDDLNQKTSIRAYNLLERSAEYKQLLDARQHTLSKGANYYATVENTKGIMHGLIKKQGHHEVADGQSDHEKVLESLNTHVESVRRLSQPLITSIRQDVYSIPAKKDRDEKEILRSLKEMESNYRDVLSGYRDSIKKKDTLLRDRFRLRNEITDFLQTHSTIGSTYESAKEFSDKMMIFLGDVRPRLEDKSTPGGGVVALVSGSKEEQEFIRDMRVRLEQRRSLTEKYLLFFTRLRIFENEMSQGVASQDKIKRSYLALVDAERQNLKPEIIIGQENAYLKSNMKKNIMEIMQNYRGRRRRKSIRVDVEEREEYRIRYSLSPTNSESTTMTRVTRKYVRNLKDTIEDLKMYESDISPPFIEGKKPEEILAKLREKAKRLENMQAPKFDELKEEIQDFISQVTLSDENKRKLNEVERKMIEIESNYALLEEKTEHSKSIVNLLVIFFKNFIELSNSIHAVYNPSMKTSRDLTEDEEKRITESVLLVKSFRDDILEKMTQRKDPEYERDRRVLKTLFTNLERELSEFRKIRSRRMETVLHEERETRIWDLRTRIKDTNVRVKEASRTLSSNKKSLPGDLDLPILYAFESFADGSFSNTFRELERKIREILKEDEELRSTVPVEYMNSDLPQLRDQLLKHWNELRLLYEKSRDQIQMAKNYYALTERIERFISVSEDKIKFWKSRPQAKESTADIREYFEKCRKDIINDLLVRLLAEAGLLFGSEAAVDRTAGIQSRVIRIMDELKELSETPVVRSPPEFEFPLSEQIEGADLSYLLKAKIHPKLDESFEAQWFRDGSPVSAPNALRKSENGWLTHRLTSPNANPTEWKLKVVSKNSGLSTESSIKVGPQSCPYWAVKPPQFIEVNESDDNNVSTNKKAIKLECDVGGTPKPSVSWFLDGIPADKTKVLILEDEQVGGKSTKHSLTLPKNEQFGLTKNIEIKAKNPYGQISSTTSIVRIVVPPKFILPLIDLELEKEPSILELKCKITGVPRPDIYWFKDGRAINYNNANVTSFYDGKEAILMADPFAEGKYAVKAVNSAGEASSSARVSLEEPKRKPVIVTHLKDQTIPKGCHSADIEIDVEGIPKPDLTWYKDGIPFSPKNFGEEILDKDHHVHRRVALKNLRTGENTKIRVKAVNEVGECESYCSLYSPKEDLALPPPPKIVVEESSMQKSEAHLHVTPLSSPPKPIVPEKPKEFKTYDYGSRLSKILTTHSEEKKTLIDKTTPTSSVSSIFTTESYKTSPIKILNSVFTTETQKTSPIKTFNSVFTTETQKTSPIKTFNSVVTTETQKTSPIKTLNSLFTMETQKTSPIKSESIIRTTQPEVSKPSETLSRTIERKYEPPPSPKFERFQSFSKTFERASLLPQTTTSSRITPISSPTFKVEEPKKESSLNTLNSTFKTITQYEEESKKREPIVSNVKTPSLLPKSSSEVKAAMSTSRVSLIPRLEPLKKPEVPKKPVGLTSSSSSIFGGGSRSTETKSSTTTTTTQQKAFTSTRSRSFVSDSKKSGAKTSFLTPSTSPSTQRRSLDLSSQQQKPPRFVVPLDETNTTEGKSVEFRATVSGQPAPEIIWRLNDLALDKTSYTVHGCETVLTLNKVSPKDSGRISCVAVNPRGTAVSTANLIVEPAPPEIIQPLDGFKEIEAGTRLTLEVVLGKVEGDEESEGTNIKFYDIVWTKNGEKIPSPTEETRMKSYRKGNVVTLIIFRVKDSDSGTYEVLIKKPSTSLSSSCNVKVVPEGTLSREATPSSSIHTSTLASSSKDLSLKGFRKISMPQTLKIKSPDNSRPTLSPLGGGNSSSSTYETHEEIHRYQEIRESSRSPLQPSNASTLDRSSQNFLGGGKSSMTISSLSSNRGDTSIGEGSSRASSRRVSLDEDGNQIIEEEEDEDRIMYPSSLKALLKNSEFGGGSTLGSSASELKKNFLASLYSNADNVSNTSTTTTTNYTFSKSREVEDIVTSSQIFTESNAYVPPAWTTIGSSSSATTTNNNNNNDSRNAINTQSLAASLANSRAAYSLPNSRGRTPEPRNWTSPKYVSFRSGFQRKL